MTQVPTALKVTRGELYEQTEVLPASMVKVTGLPDSPPVAVGV